MTKYLEEKNQYLKSEVERWKVLALVATAVCFGMALLMWLKGCGA